MRFGDTLSHDASDKIASGEDKNQTLKKEDILEGHESCANGGSLQRDEAEINGGLSFEWARRGSRGVASAEIRAAIVERVLGKERVRENTNRVWTCQQNEIQLESGESEPTASADCKVTHNAREFNNYEYLQ